MTFIISMNIRGLRADLKFFALKDLFLSAKPKIILVQETMHNKQESISYFKKMFPSWFMVASKAKGLLGGLAVMWDPSWIKAKAYKCFVGILISAVISRHSCPINILNIYAPYKNKSLFWEFFFDSGIFDVDSLMIAGDMNITISSEEHWGKCRKYDPLSD